MTYQELRSEFNTIAHHLRKTGAVCANCGSAESVEWHHIVPLSKGGTNNLSNIVPLCRRCHFGAHQKVWKGEAHRTGRPKKQPPKGYKNILDDYFAGNIKRKECLRQLGITNNRLTEIWWYNEYHDEWLQKQKAQEEFQGPARGIEIQVEVPMREAWQTKSYVLWRVKMMLEEARK